MSISKLILFTLFSTLLAGCQLQHNSEPHEAYDSFIPVDSANKMISSFIASIPDGDTTQTLSLLLPADDLRYYLCDTNIKELKIMLAHPLSYINAGHQGVYGGLKSDAFTIVITGVNNLGNYVLSGDNMVANKVHRCPPFCLSSGTASNNLIE